MRLITHNMLQCHVKSCSQDSNYPLAIQEAVMEEIEADFNPDFITKMLTRMDWNAFVQTSLLLGITGLPSDLPADYEQDFLQSVHHIALEHKIQEGKMVCNGCGHVYPIVQGIPNMLLTNTEAISYRKFEDKLTEAIHHNPDRDNLFRRHIGYISH